MELGSLLPIVMAAIVGLIVLRMVIGAIKTSAKLMVWTIVAAAAVGLGYLWYEGQATEGQSIPTLNIPSDTR